MKIEKTKLGGVFLITPRVHKDHRGFFFESYQKERFKTGGIDVSFVQDNHSKSSKNTLRGLHGQRQYPQGKLVRVIHGEIFDVAVDIRKESPTYSQWEGVVLSSENFKQLYVPPGFVHGFCVLTSEAEVEYKCTEIYHPEDEFSVLWNDPQINIKWPIKNPVLSDKDSKAPTLSQLK